MDTTPPPELANLLEAGDPASVDRAWQVFLRRHNDTILRATRCFSSDYDGQMDRYGHVLEELRRDNFKRLRSYSEDPRGRFRTWIMVVCRRLCVDYHRSLYGRARESGNDAREDRARRRRLVDMMVDELNPDGQRDTRAMNPERELLNQELSQALESALAQLEPEDRLLLQLRYYDGLPVRKVALVMRYPTVFHVYRRLKPLLRALREQLEERGFKDSQP